MLLETQMCSASDGNIFRLISGQFLRDPYPTLAALQEKPGVVPIVTNGLRMWLVTRYDDAKRVLADQSLGKDLVAVKEKIEHCMVRPEQHARLPRPLRRSMFEQDGASHRRQRSLLAHLFTPRRVASMRPELERVADDLLDALPTDDAIDFVRGYSRPLVTTVLGDFVGVPPDARDEFPDWENLILTATSAEEATEAGRKMYDFCHEMVALKRKEPHEDVFTELVTMAREDKLDEEELVATVFLFLVAGVEATSAMANGALVLMTHPDQLTKVLADPSLWPGCVEEILRFETSFRILPPRHCPTPIELDEVTIPADELIVVANSAANRDPSRFEHPDVFDITRPSHDHLAFGHGPHRCYGAALGKLEVEVGLSKLLTRYPRTKLAIAPESLRWRPATFLRRLESLPVVVRQ
ncbi:cytochrome P450 [Lentzea sp. NPDC004782]|uniref:cytochrome P450 family protein n=1 Tax=Lentzea sp. NPDC004782 TaxID=3154458 RepID=UPI0033B74A25